MLAKSLALAFTAFAAAVATAADSARLRLEIGKEVAPCEMAFSPDGQLLAFAGPDASLMAKSVVVLWDLSSGKRKWRQPAPNLVDPLGGALAFSPDGKTLAVAMSAPSSTVALFNVHSGNCRTVIKATSVPIDPRLNIAYSADGKQMVTCSQGEPPSAYALRLWHSDSGKMAGEMKFPRISNENSSRAVDSVLATLNTGDHYPAFSPDGSLIAVKTLVRVELWNARTHKRLAAVALTELPPASAGGSFTSGESHSQPWPAPLFSPDGKTLVAAGLMFDDAKNEGRDNPRDAPRDGAVYVIDVEKGKSRKRIEGFPNTFLSFTADGRCLLGAASSFGHLRLARCDLRTYAVASLIDSTVPGNRVVEHIAFSPDGGKLATTERDFRNGVIRQDAYCAHVWDTRTGKQLAEFEGHSATRSRGGSARSAAGAPSGRGGIAAIRPPGIAAGGPFGNGLPGNMFAGAGKARIEALPTLTSFCLLFSPDARRLAIVNGASATDTTVDVWTLPTAAASASDRIYGAQKQSRTWNSADGKFHVEAVLVNVDDDSAILKKHDGSEIKVPLDRLSDADRRWIESRRKGKSAEK